MNSLSLWCFNYFILLQDTLHLKVSVGQNSNKSDRINQRNLGDKFGGNKFVVKGELILFTEY